MPRGIQEPVSLERFCKFHEGGVGWNSKEADGKYKIYLKSVKGENECWKKTRHKNQKYRMGMNICLDCGADCT
jgi:hypothetical protein